MGVTTQAAFVQSMILVFAGGRTGLSAVVTGASVHHAIQIPNVDPSNAEYYNVALYLRGQPKAWSLITTP